MAYVTIEQLEQRLGSTLYARLTDRIAGTTADDVVAQQIVDEAEAQANSFLATRFATPIDLGLYPQVAAALRARVLDVAEFLAWKSSPFVTDVPERLRVLHEEARQWLMALADGRVALPGGVQPASRGQSETTPLYSAPPRVFTSESLDGL